MSDRKLCLAVGAGAIGKSVVGVTFEEMGCDVMFADVSKPVIDDLQSRGGYRIKTARFGQADQWQTVMGMRAYPIDSEEVKARALCADYICTAIGTGGLKAFLPTLTGWINQRILQCLNPNQSIAPVYLLFFENETACQQMVTDALVESIGAIPSWLIMAKVSVERMTKPIPPVNGQYDVVGERVFPIFIPKTPIQGSGLETDSHFEPVGDIDAYYYRKLYTNNLGHAALGYIGAYYGYTAATQTMADERIYTVMNEALKTAGAMLMRLYGFSEKSMRDHLEELPKRFWNQGLDDDLSRLARDPIRKLSPNERIVGAMKKCAMLGIPDDAIAAIIEILCYAIRYKDPDDPAACELARLRETNGTGWIVTHIAGIDPADALYQKILDADAAMSARGIQ